MQTANGKRQTARPTGSVRSGGEKAAGDPEFCPDDWRPTGDRSTTRVAKAFLHAVVGSLQDGAIPPQKVKADRRPVIGDGDQQVQEAPKPVCSAQIWSRCDGDRARLTHLATRHDDGEPAHAPVVGSKERKGEDLRFHGRRA